MRRDSRTANRRRSASCRARVRLRHR
ncbi:MAG: hypothetical protein HOQ37_23605 [Cupriavidus sp.]|nr:hypothetical protein [Cupriavidus sp.]